jgi:hypothetical protein
VAVVLSMPKARPPKSKPRIEERVYKSAWHALIFMVGVYEYRTQRTKLAKVLAAGCIGRSKFCVPVKEAFVVKRSGLFLGKSIFGIVPRGPSLAVGQ